MNNDALVAALGMDAVAAVNGYRHSVRAEATRRGLCLRSEPLSDVVAVSPGVCMIIDPIDIRLAFVHTRGSALTGRTLTGIRRTAGRCRTAGRAGRSAPTPNPEQARWTSFPPLRRSSTGRSVNPTGAASRP